MFRKILIPIIGIILAGAVALAITACDDGGGNGNGGDPVLSGTVSITPEGTVSTGTELTATYTGSEAVSFQWKRNGNNVGTANTTNPNTYTPTQEGNYSVTVSLSGYQSKNSTNTVTVEDAPSSAKQITAFTLAGYDGVIDQEAKTISVMVPLGTNVTSLTPVITVSTNASYSPTEPQDFSSSVTYRVTAEDETFVDYTVTVGFFAELDISDDVAYPNINAFITAFNNAINDSQYDSVSIIGERDGISQKIVLAIPDGKSVNWTATISGTADPLIELTDIGTFNITDGDITATTNRAIILNANGVINISGGTVTSEITIGMQGTIVITGSGKLNISGGTVRNTAAATTDGATAVRITETGEVNITGGIVSSDIRAAIGVASASTGATINISQAAGSTTLVTSGNTLTNQGTIFIVATSELNISGGTVINTSANTNTRAIQNPAGSTVNITGGRVKISNNERAIRNTAGVTISGTAEVDGFSNPYPGVPGAVESFTAKAGFEQVVLTWTTPTNDGGSVITGYEVTMNNWVNKVELAASILTHTYTGLEVGTEYTFKVRAVNAVGAGAENTETATPIDALVYIITGSGTLFNAARGGTAIGTANQPIQTVIDAIKTDAGENDVTIKFGDNSQLDIGMASIDFNNSGSSWGLINLEGSIISANGTNTEGTIILNGPSINSTADIANTGTFGRAIYNNSTGTVTICDGTVSAISVAIFNNTTGAVTISGGTVSATTGVTVSNRSTGVITISGGTVSATTGYAVGNTFGGKVIVSGTANITSASTSNSGGTISIGGSGDSTLRLEITGGIIENTGTGTSGSAIYNSSNGKIIISGGKVSATTGYAIMMNSGTGKVEISDTAEITANRNQPAIYISSNITTDVTLLEITGGTVKNTASDIAISNLSRGGINISGGTISATTGGAVSSAYGALVISGGTISTTSGYAVSTATGTVTISGGNISTTTGNAVYINATGVVTISGGIVSATEASGIAARIRADGKIIVSDSAWITSVNSNNNYGTIFLDTNSAGTPGVRLEITGGTVENTSGASYSNAVRNSNAIAEVIISGGTITSNRAIYNGSTGTITISGGNISATTTGAAVTNLTGTVNISGGTLSATAGYTVSNNGTGTTTISGGTISATTGVAVYNTEGEIIISGAETLITSANITANQGTIYLLRSSGTLTINSGKVENTAYPDNTNAKAIYASQAGTTVNINTTEPPLPVISPAYNP